MSIENTLRVIIREEIIRALEEYKKSEVREPLSELPLFMNAKDISKSLQCSSRTAYSIMEQKDFPLLRIGKMKRVKRDDFLIWINNNRHEKGAIWNG